MASHRGRSWVAILALGLATASSVIWQPLSVVAEEPLSEPEKKLAAERKERYTKWMRSYAEGTKIHLLGAEETDKSELAELVPNPVLRYSDEEHRVPDSTLWVYTRNDRPVAFQKVEGNNWGGYQQWTICFTSLSEGLVHIAWPKTRQFTTKRAGVVFRSIPDAEAPSENPRLRVAQLKSLTDRFSARFGVQPDGTGGAESRTMPKPLFEYSDGKTKLPLGAVFGLSSTGTNPSALLLIEARDDGAGKLRWEYAHARMTANSVHARLDDVEVWVDKSGPIDSYENWTYFFLQRDFP